MTRQQAEVVEKRRFLRQEYGGLMTIAQLARELGLKDTRAAKKWAVAHDLRFVLMTKQGGQSAPRFDTDQFAKVLMSQMRPAQMLR